MELYYDHPVQVRFWDVQDYIGGIAYHDYIICGCCGQAIFIKEILEEAKNHSLTADEAIIELSWINISDEISGE